MNDLKDNLKMQVFTINPGIIKNISKLGISLDEFILILYFINIENKLDLERINKYTDFTNEHILELFNSLLSKSLIELKMIEIAPNKHDEEISLEVFYDKLIMSKETPKKEVDEKVSLSIFEKFESEFGRTLSPTEYKVIEEWLSKGIEPTLIEDALKEAVLSGVTTLRYIEAIIREWSKNGKKSHKKNEISDEGEYNELFDYDWLDNE